MKQRKLLSELHSEFKGNKKAIANHRSAEERAINANIELINLIAASREELSYHNLESQFFESFPSNELAFADAVNKTIQNGRLNLFDSDGIISTLLYQQTSYVDIMTVREEKQDKWNNAAFLPFLLPFISLREWIIMPIIRGQANPKLNQIIISYFKKQN